MACHRMIDREGSAATTLLRSMTETPSVSQANGISKFPLVEMKRFPLTSTSEMLGIVGRV